MAFTTFEVVKGKKVQVKCPDYVDDNALNLTENAVKVLEKRYVRRDVSGVPLETPAGMFYRVARHVAEMGDNELQKVDEVTRQYYDLLTEKRFYPNSPTFTGAATPLGQLAACFVLPLEDDMGSSDAGILSTLRNAGLIQQTGGGNGFSFGRLRPKGDSVSSSGGKASGPVGFMRAYDAVFGEVAQGGVRRGANMAVLPVWHVDVEDFVECKAKEGDLANFNISVAITDEFMRAVKEDDNFWLVNPRDGKPVRVINAKKLFDKIVKYAYRNGEPGLLFIDAANRSNPVPHLYTLEATNPCFAPGTLIQTKQGHYPIKDLVGRTVDVWDGKNWAKVDNFRVTGRYQKMLRIALKGGENLEVTPYHKMVLENGVEVEAKEIKAGDRLLVSNAPLSHGVVSELGAYLKGFLLGDGTYSSEGERPELWLYPPKKVCADRLQSSLMQLEQKNFKTNTVAIAGFREAHYSGGRDLLIMQGMTPSQEELYPWVTEHKSSFPSEVFLWDMKSKSEFIAGLFDADGTAYDGSNGFGYQLSSIHKEFLLGVKSLLMTMGVTSAVSIMKRAGTKDFNDGRGSYKTKDCWRISISQAGSIDLAKIVKFERLMDFSRKTVSYVAKTRYNQVLSVEESGIEEEVYCCTVDSTHKVALTCGVITGQCGEQYLGPYENCCLGSVNLAQHWVYVDGKPVVDWDRLEETIRLSTRFLDDVVSANAYVPSVPQVKEAALRARRIGLGIMGLADMMYALGIRYGSEEGQAFAAQIMEFVRYHCMDESISLAEERGSFLAFQDSIYDPNQHGGMKWERPVPLSPYTRDFGRPKLYWDVIEKGIRGFGIRNAAQTTVAPTGTIATVCGCEGYGCEPVFALGYTRHFKDGDKDVELSYTSPLFEAALDRYVDDNQGDVKYRLDSKDKEFVLGYVQQYGSLDGCPLPLPISIRHTFAVSSDILPEEHVGMQASIQAFVDNSISKTCNFGPDATEQDVADAYMLAWELGCKGLTVYVTGSRDKVVLETAATKAKKDASAEKIPHVDESALSGVTPNASESNPVPIAKRPRPSRLTGATYRKETPLGKAYVTINDDENGDPFEVFLNVGKVGSETSAVSEAVGRLISLVLRMSDDVLPHDRLRQVMDELRDIGGGRSMGFGLNRVRSLPDGIAQVLSDHLADVPYLSNVEFILTPSGKVSGVIGELCPECGEATLLNIEGCRKCQACGYSEC